MEAGVRHRASLGLCDVQCGYLWSAQFEVVWHQHKYLFFCGRRSICSQNPELLGVVRFRLSGIAGLQLMCFDIGFGGVRLST